MSFIAPPRLVQRIIADGWLQPTTTSQLPTGFLAASTQPARDVPEIIIFDNDVYCNGHRINTRIKPVTLILFRTFITRPQPYLSREQLLAAIYPELDVANSSERLRTSLNLSLTKLVLRARKLAKDALHGKQDGIEWFPKMADGWGFFHINPCYFSSLKGQPCHPAPNTPTNKQ